MFLGDYLAGDTVDFRFTTRQFSSGTPYTLASGAVAVYKADSTTESTAGVTLTADFDGRTGTHHVRITTASDGTFYANGSQFDVVLTAGTVDSVSVVGEVIARFSLGVLLRPTTAGRTLDVTSTGGGGIDWGNVENPTTTLNLSGTTVATLTNAPSDSSGTTTLLSRLTSTRAGYLDNLSGGAVALASGVNTTQWGGTAVGSANVRANLVQILGTAPTEGDAGRLAGSFTTFLDVASPVFTAASVNQTGDSYARIGSTGSGLTSLAPSATALSTAQWTNTRAGYLDNLSGGAVALASGVNTTQWGGTAVGSANVRANLTQILGTAVTETSAGYLAAAFTTMLDVATPVFTAASVNQTGDSYARIGATGSGLTSLAPSATALSTAQWTNTRAGYLDNLSAGAVATAAALATVDDFVDTEVAAIKAVTDKLDTALELDGSVYRFTTNALEQAPAGGGGSSDWTADERDAIRAILGIPASGTTPDDPTAGILDTIRDAVAGVQADTDNIQTRLPASLVSGRMDSSVGAYQSGLTPLQPAVAGRTLDVSAGGVAAANVVSMAADTLTASALAADAVTEIQSGLSTLTASGVWSHGTRVLTAGTNIALAKGTGVTGFNDLDASGVRAAVGLASANLDTQLAAIDDFVDTEVAAVKAVTDKLDTALELDGLVYRFTTNALELAPTDWTANERTAARAVLGIPASGTTPDDPTTGILDTIRDAVAGVQSDTDNIQTRLPASLVSGRMDSSVGAYQSGQAPLQPAVAGRTLDVSSGGVAAANVVSMAADTLTASALAADAVAEIQSGLSTLTAGGVWSHGTRVLTAGTNIALAKGTGVTGFNDLDASGVRGAVGLASANLDTQLSAIDDFVDTEVAAVKAVTDKLDTAMELDGSVYRFTVNALEQAPAGGGGGDTDWTADERDAIRAILGIPPSGTTPADPTAGILDTIRDAIAGVQSDTDNIQTRLPASLVSGRMDSSVGAYQSGQAPLQPAVAGRTLDVSSGGVAAANVVSMAADTLTAAALASDAVAEIQSGLSTLTASGVWAHGTRLLTAGTNIVLTKGTGVTGFNDLDAAGIRGAVGLVAANLDTQLSAIAGYVDTEVAAIKAKTDNLPASPAATGDIPSAAAIASQVRTELTTELGRIDAAVSTRLAASGYTAPLTAAGTRGALGMSAADLDTQLDHLASLIVSGGGGGGGGDGSVEVDEDYGGSGLLAYKTSADVGIDNAVVRAYLKADYDAGNTGLIYVVASTRTTVTGGWELPLMLDPETYTIVYFKQGEYGPDTREVTVT